MQKSHSPKESLHPKIITINILDVYLKFFSIWMYIYYLQFLVGIILYHLVILESTV